MVPIAKNTYALKNGKFPVPAQIPEQVLVPVVASYLVRFASTTESRSSKRTSKLIIIDHTPGLTCQSHIPGRRKIK
jgi:hypothetical protein